MKETGKELTLDQTLRRITLSGCLCMMYLVGSWSPLATDFFRSLGAGEVFFGLLAFPVGLYRRLNSENGEGRSQL